jgi:hypothetical protein
MNKKEREKELMNRYMPGVLGLLTAIGLVLIGCDHDDDLSGETFELQPRTVTMIATEPTVELQVIGGVNPFVWTLSDATRGTISGAGRRVTYTRTADNGVNTVKATDSRGFSSTSTIVQRDDPEELEALVIAPTTATTDGDGVIIFTATGGTGDYHWEVDPGGSMSPRTGASTVYTSDSTNTDVVALSDGDTIVFTIVTKN